MHRNSPAIAGTRQLHPLRTWQIASVSLIVIASLSAAASTCLTWQAYTSAHRNDLLANVVDWVAFAAQLGTTVCFLRWLWLARLNSELLSAEAPRKERGWVIGGWVCPIVNFWYPHVVITDIGRASNPSVTSEHSAHRGTPGGTTINWWWGAFLTSQLATVVEGRITGPPLAIVVVDTVYATFLGIAGVLLVAIIRRISSWQSAQIHRRKF
ncbi:DUF4328 domain-containing protein [Amycolatopsis sp. NPDC049868]|uniref:DUF4328 domain-containing protein n=1 Tax=Amycolatopsis sp. NPDC049868 TaxID=3363934 RepID=UPI0037B7687F